MTSPRVVVGPGRRTGFGIAVLPERRLAAGACPWPRSLAQAFVSLGIRLRNDDTFDASKKHYCWGATRRRTVTA